MVKDCSCWNPPLQGGRCKMTYEFILPLEHCGMCCLRLRKPSWSPCCHRCQDQRSPASHACNNARLTFSCFKNIYQDQNLQRNATGTLSIPGAWKLLRHPLGPFLCCWVLVAEPLIHLNMFWCQPLMSIYKKWRRCGGWEGAIPWQPGNRSRTSWPNVCFVSFLLRESCMRTRPPKSIFVFLSLAWTSLHEKRQQRWF